MSAASSVLVLLAEGTEEMEFTIIVDVLRRAEVEVVVAGVAGDGTAGDGPVTCSRGVRIVPDVALADLVDDHGEVAGRGAPFEVVVLPGGAGGTERFAADPRVGALLRTHAAAGRLVAAICAAPAALAAHEVAANRAVTSHPSVRAALAPWCSSYREDSIVSADGLLTSRGPGTAFDFAFALVERLRGPDVVESVRAPMMFD